MIKFDLVFLPLHDWKKCEAEGFRTRDAHLLKEFDKHPSVGKILVVDRPITLPEIVIKRRPLKTKTGTVIYKKGPIFVSRLTGKIYALDLFDFDLIKPLIRKRRWWQHSFEKPSTFAAVKSVLQIVGFDRPVLWTATPLTHKIMNELDVELRVFDAIDNWLAHPQAGDVRSQVKIGYEKMRTNADIIFTNSLSLKTFLSKERDNTFFVSNGIDKEFFSLDFLPLPDDLKKIKKPVVGYAGKIQERLDVDLVNFLTKSLPDVSFVFIGQIVDKKWFKKINKENNFFYLGDKKYEDLPAYLEKFDVCIMPHKISELTESMNPLKTYEYIASGKPVVSTKVSGTDEFADLIAIADTKEEFLRAVRRSLSLNENEKRLIAMRSRERLTDRHSWEFKSNTMIGKISTVLREKRGVSEKRSIG